MLVDNTSTDGRDYGNLANEMLKQVQQDLWSRKKPHSFFTNEA
jgi:hypothetical protein